MPEPERPQFNRWKVGDFHFDANSNRLFGAGREVLLEPKPAALLAYLCENAGRSIGRDELLSAVWHGQIVSDNSINRAIVLLRKALRDDSKARRYIATIPKLGYRLIAEVVGVEQPATLARSGGLMRLWRQFALGGTVLGLALWMVFSGSRSTSPKPLVRELAPLSRLSDSQFNAHLASDGRRLAYTASDGTWDVIFLLSGDNATPQPISALAGHANFPTWSHSGDFLVYQFMSGDRCEIHRIARDQFSARAAEVIYQCLPGSYSELSLSPDDTTLYFLERPTPDAPYAVYSLALDQQSKKRLSQPMVSGYGNHFVDVHPESGALLLLSDHAPGKTSVYVIDPASDSFTLRRRFSYGLDSAIWSHREGFMVHPSRHPSYQLLESSLDGGPEQVLVSDSRRIRSPRRIGVPGEASGEYLFTSYLYNRDIRLRGMADPTVSSAVMDYLPALSHRGDLLAFISKRSGESQIWLKHLDDGSLTAIEMPDAGRRFYDLAWSFDDTRLLANTSTGVLVYSLAERVYTHNISLPLPAYAVSWHDEQTLSLSHFEQGRWRAYRLALDGGDEPLPLDSRWAFTLGNARQQLWLDQSLRVFRSSQELTALNQCASPLWRYQLRYRLDGDDLYCHAVDADGDLLRFDAAMNSERLPGVVHRFEFFSARAGLVASTHVASSHSDIMRTRSKRME
ncbi:MAG: winged helix-turn-helix domain-containing protein [Pseudomonadota bacterium]